MRSARILFIQSLVIFAAFSQSVEAQGQDYGNLNPGYGAAPQQYASVQSGGQWTTAQWFSAYDQIRRQAQMTPQERSQADQLLSMGFSCLVPGDMKTNAQNLLTKLVQRYVRATKQIQQLPIMPATQKLQQGYYTYFATAARLFADYLKVQDDLFSADASGNPIATQLMDRKQQLENLNNSVQALDGQLRSQYGIAAYHYSSS